jgi:predicted dinucleotide-binding enzyme
VKALNTVNYKLMADPSILRDPHDLFLCGNDAEAKAQVADLLASFGWQREHLLDLGTLDAARGMEAYLLLWLRRSQLSESPLVSVRIVR